MSAAEHLQEAIDVGCTRDDHDHVADHRAEVLAEAAAALTARAVELSAMAEEDLRRDLEETAQEWHSAALVVTKLVPGSAGEGTGGTAQALAGESTQPTPSAEYAHWTAITTALNAAAAAGIHIGIDMIGSALTDLSDRAITYDRTAERWVVVCNDCDRTLRECGHCPHCETCHDCGTCSGTGCTCRCEVSRG